MLGKMVWRAWGSVQCVGVMSDWYRGDGRKGIGKGKGNVM